VVTRGPPTEFENMRVRAPPLFCENFENAFGNLGCPKAPSLHFV